MVVNNISNILPIEFHQQSNVFFFQRGNLTASEGKNQSFFLPMKMLGNHWYYWGN